MDVEKHQIGILGKKTYREHQLGRHYVSCKNEYIHMYKVTHKLNILSNVYYIHMRAEDYKLEREFRERNHGSATWMYILPFFIQ